MTNTYLPTTTTTTTTSSLSKSSLLPRRDKPQTPFQFCFTAAITSSSLLSFHFPTMGNCTASKLAMGDEDEAVTICRERKKLIKAAVERRYALAEAHVRYTQSLSSVAAAINLFVTRHTAPTPMLITLPDASSSPPSSSSETAFLRQTPSEPKTEAVRCHSSSSSPCSSSSSSSSLCLLGEEEVRNGQVDASGYFFSGTMPPPPPSPGVSFGWDFFDPFGGVRAAEEAVMMSGLGRSSDEELRVLREEEGIPELEEEDAGEGTTKLCSGGCNGSVGSAVVDGDGKVAPFCDEKRDEDVPKVAEDSCHTNGAATSVCDGQKELTAVGTPARERDLLDALRDIKDHFLRAHDSGKDVGRMLQANSRAYPNSGLVEETKDNSSKLIQAITWHRSPSSQSSYHRSFLASSSRSTSWTESKGGSDMFDDYGVMESGNHSQTLENLYAWEKKLYEEVKAADDTRKLYERKCSQLRNQDANRSESRSTEKIRAATKELYTRIFVVIRTAETISRRIDKLRDEELQPQLIELLQGFLRTWKVMLESHETQRQVIYEVNSFTCPAYGKFCSDLHRLATVQLDVELQNWRSCFTNYTTAQKEYAEALNGWLSKFMAPEVEFYSRGRSSSAPFRIGSPPLLVICHDWLKSLRRLPDRSVSLSLKSFHRDLKLLWIKQGEEQHQKRRMDHIAKELDRRVVAFQKTENRILESKLSENKNELDMRQRLEYLAGRKDLLDMFKVRLEIEKARHLDCMQESQRVTLHGLRTGFTNVFNSISDFSRDLTTLYDELLKYSEKAKEALEGSKEKLPTATCIEGSHAEAKEPEVIEAQVS